MKNTIIVNNALKYYKAEELLNSNGPCQEMLSKELNMVEYQNMQNKIRGKYTIIR